MAKKNLEISSKNVLVEKSISRQNIKLRIPGESFWAYQLTKDTARVCNILLSAEIGLDDIVRFNPENNEVVSLLIKKTTTFAAEYKFSKKTIKQKYKILYKYFEERNIKVEGLAMGVVLLSVAVGIPTNVVKQIIKECPVKTKLCLE